MNLDGLMNSNQRERYLVIFLIGGLAISGVYAALGLFADGSYFLFSILSSQGFCDFYKAREFVQLITQAPLVFAIKAGVNNLNTLIYTHSFGLIFIPLMFWLTALIQQRKTDLFWLFVIAFSVSYLSSGLFAIGEYNLTYSMAALCASILLLEGDISKINATTLILTAFCLTHSYESMVFLGPLLGMICILRFFSTKNSLSLFLKIALTLSCLLFITGFLISLWSLFFPRDPSGLVSATSNIIFMLGSMHLLYLILMGFLLMNSLFFNKKYALFFAWLLSIVHLINFNFWNSPVMNYNFRTLSGVLLFAVIAISAYYYFLYTLNLRTLWEEKTKLHTLRWYFYFSTKTHDIIEKINQTKSNPIPVIFFISLALPFYFQTVGFYAWASAYEQEVLTQQGFIPIEQTKFARTRYTWKWANPSLSIVLRGDQTGSVITNGLNYYDWQPFDPHKIDNNVSMSFKKKTPFYRRTLTPLANQLIG